MRNVFNTKYILLFLFDIASKMRLNQAEDSCV